MSIFGWIHRCAFGALAFAFLWIAGPSLAADHVSGQVLGGGAPIAKSTVTLWEASDDDDNQNYPPCGLRKYCCEYDSDYPGGSKPCDRLPDNVPILSKCSVVGSDDLIQRIL